MSREVMAIRIDDHTRARVARAARRRGKSASDAIRYAIDSWLDKEEAEGTPYDRVSELIGSFEGPGNLSTGGGARVAEGLKARRNRGPK
jgi:Arc/MetJ-type ribon-helix-helix transcriptional regulator